jgi:hypothetical protein
LNSIIPLAGPEIRAGGNPVKPLREIGGGPMLQRVLCDRPWMCSGALRPEQMVFVIAAGPATGLICDSVDAWFEDAKSVILSDLTRGAAMSALAGVSLIEDWDDWLCIDLADITFQSAACATFANIPDDVAAVVPYFESQDPKFSYLRLDGHNRVLEAREKVIISSHATAGVLAPFPRGLPQRPALRVSSP